MKIFTFLLFILCIAIINHANATDNSLGMGNIKIKGDMKNVKITNKSTNMINIHQASKNIPEVSAKYSKLYGNDSVFGKVDFKNLSQNNAVQLKCTHNHYRSKDEYILDPLKSKTVFINPEGDNRFSSKSDTSISILFNKFTCDCINCKFL